MSWFLIPLTSQPQSFQIALGGINYQMDVYWNSFLNDETGGWQMDLANSDTSEPLVAGVPFITGADLLDGLSYLGIEGSLYVYTQGMPEETPTFTDLGLNSNLYFVTAT